ncbi:uncharacterized protein LOC113204854 [Frankliniella occidentalis]|uniref:Uncharacterized protein LOC113204854 n=1 Tax=Frankliniella occidentalis TaxID=133901 RepID=A0A6J1S9U5_FRAOC|nr:uncharacterized protein LOC113204854 [Frankliniella occidentalis]
MAIQAVSHALVLVVLLTACLCAPQFTPTTAPSALSGDLDLAALAGELLDVAGRLHEVSDSLTAPAERDAVGASPTETTAGTSPLEPSVAQPTAAALPDGLPDNDTFRRRLFFIGDLGDDYVRVPARDVLPPYEDGEPESIGETAALPFSFKTAVHSAANQAVNEDARTSFVPLHEKDLLRRPGSRFRLDQRAASRDGEIRAAMEAEGFQGPLPEATTGTAMRPGHGRHTYRWTVASREEREKEQ